jgi:hypothetical protein
MASTVGLPEDIFFDLVSADELQAVHELEVQGKPISILSCLQEVPPLNSAFSQDSRLRKPLPLSNYGMFSLLLPYNRTKYTCDTLSASVRQMLRTSSLAPSFPRQAVNAPSLAT